MTPRTLQRISRLARTVVAHDGDRRLPALPVCQRQRLELARAVLALVPPRRLTRAEQVRVLDRVQLR